MLVLTRKPNERLRIGDDITVTVLKIGPNKVRLGIDAPRHMEIKREELDNNPANDLSPIAA